MILPAMLTSAHPCADAAYKDCLHQECAILDWRQVPKHTSGTLLVLQLSNMAWNALIFALRIPNPSRQHKQILLRMSWDSANDVTTQTFFKPSVSHPLTSTWIWPCGGYIISYWSLTHQQGHFRLDCWPDTQPLGILWNIPCWLGSYPDIMTHINLYDILAPDANLLTVQMGLQTVSVIWLATTTTSNRGLRNICRCASSLQHSKSWEKISVTRIVCMWNRIYNWSQCDIMIVFMPFTWFL